MPKKAKASSRPEQSWIILPDTHYGEHDDAAIACALEAIRWVKPTGVIHLGDVGEWDSVSHWRWSRQKRPPLEYLIQSNDDDEPGLLDREAAIVNAGLDEIDAACKDAKVEHKEVCLGNHDDWLTRFCTEFPYIRSRYNPVALMRLKERGYKAYPFDMDDFPTVGRSKLHYYHGHHVGGVMHSRQHCMKFGSSVIYGHWHDRQHYSMQQLGGCHDAWSLGCLKRLSKTFLRGKPHNWSHAFAVVDVLPNRNFHVGVVPIHAGVCIMSGRVIDGNEIAKEKAA